MKNSAVTTSWMESSSGRNVVMITMNNSSVHQLSLDLCSALTNTLNELEKDDQCHAYILTSNITQRIKQNKRPIFCAGLDLKLMGKDDINLKIEYSNALSNLWDAFNLCTKPIIGAINGDAIAGGALLACLCDYRILVNDHFIQFKETRLGLDIDDITYKIAYRCAGSYDKASYVTQTGKTFSGNNAIKYGLASDIIYAYTSLDVTNQVIKHSIKVLNNDYLPADMKAAGTSRQRGRMFMVDKGKMKIQTNKNLSTLSTLKNKVLNKEKKSKL